VISDLPANRSIPRFSSKWVDSQLWLRIRRFPASPRKRPKPPIPRFSPESRKPPIPSFIGKSAKTADFPLPPEAPRSRLSSKPRTEQCRQLSLDNRPPNQVKTGRGSDVEATEGVKHQGLADHHRYQARPRSDGHGISPRPLSSKEPSHSLGPWCSRAGQDGRAHGHAKAAVVRGNKSPARETSTVPCPGASPVAEGQAATTASCRHRSRIDPPGVRTPPRG
jgi:hypothetical protein